MKDKLNDKQLELPDSSRLVRRRFHKKKKTRNKKKTPSVHQSYRDAPATLPAPCSSHNRPANLNFRLSEPMLPKSLIILTWQFPIGKDWPRPTINKLSIFFIQPVFSQRNSLASFSLTLTGNRLCSVFSVHFIFLASSWLCFGSVLLWLFTNILGNLFLIASLLFTQSDRVHSSSFSYYYYY